MKRFLGLLHQNDRLVVVTCTIALAALCLILLGEEMPRFALAYAVFGLIVVAGLFWVAQRAPIEPGCAGGGCCQGRTPEKCDCKASPEQHQPLFGIQVEITDETSWMGKRQ